MSEHVPTTEEVREKLRKAALFGSGMDVTPTQMPFESVLDAQIWWQGWHGRADEAWRKNMLEAIDEAFTTLAAHDAEVAAKAWEEGWSSRASRGYAHLKVGECVPPPAHINPYRKAVQPE